MAYEFKLPDVGEGMTEGEIVRLLVEPGEQIEKDQPVIEVQTDKVSVELPSPVAGKVKDIPVQPGDVVPVGNTIIVVDTEESSSIEEKEELKDKKAVSKTDVDSRESSEHFKQRVVQTDLDQRTRRVLAAPATRKLARELGIDIEQVSGTGPVGRVTEQDVRDFAAGKKVSSVAAVPTRGSSQKPPIQSEASVAWTEEEERVSIRGIRKQIAEKMVKSVYTIPHVTHFDQVDVTELIEARKRLKELASRHDVKLTYLPFIVKAVTSALKEFPHFNAIVDDEKKQMVMKKYFHIGIATDTEDGLVVPVIRHADKKSLLQIAREIEDLANRARDKKLTLQEMQGSTFTISNVGPIGGMFATPIINHPEVAILATHKIEMKPVVVSREKKEFDIRDFMTVSLSFDHRIIDGVDAVKFTNKVRELLEDPVSMLMF